MNKDSKKRSAHDRELGMDREITRRDFLNGMLVGAGGLATASWLPEFARAAALDAAEPQNQPGYYPPALTGMRGSHEGSYQVAHALRDGSFWDSVGQPIDTRENYDLVVVGGGISGLAAAYFYRKQAGSSARILILDNHDDFGGHAKRNEFRPGGRLLLANGGTLSIESPFPYSKEARGLMDDLGIHPAELEKRCVDHSVYKGLSGAFFFAKEHFGADRLANGAPGGFYGPSSATAKEWQQFLAKTPLSAEAQRDIVRIQTQSIDYMEGKPQAEKKDQLSRMSYKDFLLNVAKVHADVIPFYQDRTHGLYGIGIDAVPALDCWAIHFPGFQGMHLDRVPGGRLSFTALGEVTPQEDYHFHFPDGNASIARLMVRSLIPEAVPGNTVEDVVTAKVDYSRLDQAENAIRIRLNSTAVRVRHLGPPESGKDVEVTYGSGTKAFTVRAKAAVLACWNMVIPYMCPDLPAKQKAALHYGVKVPLVYTVVAIRNWTAFQKLGIQHVACPGMFHSSISLDEPVNIGDYSCSKTPDQPILVRMLRTPCQPGLPAREQQRVGHMDLLGTSFEAFERSIRDQLARVLGAGGFDPAADIQGITVNRWPHGYAYEYNPLWDPDWPEGQRPCDIARKRFGRITIANSDAAAAAYTDQAMDQAFRAVQELISSRS
ncbi:MAG TPA: FAD/NAD(P)-binding protein [Terriglobales bacterium]|nr:FAD/NAD(P)-binding protein [Terriglobales bacterium]